MKLWLMNTLFGWEYVIIQFGFEDKTRRVMYLPNGRPYVKLCGSLEFLDTTRRQWHGLTFDDRFIKAR